MVLTCTKRVLNIDSLSIGLVISSRTINQPILVPIQWYTTIGWLPCWWYPGTNSPPKVAWI